MTQDEYLATHADYYSVVLYANEELPPGSRILAVGVTVSYGLRVPALVETGFAGVTAVALANKTRSAADLSRALSARGFTHLLVDRRAPDAGWARKLGYFAWRDEAARRRYEDLLQRHARPLFACGGVYLYQLQAGKLAS
jgi:hypothetical protein